jgi:hypothetical protein
MQPVQRRAGHIEHERNGTARPRPIWDSAARSGPLTCWSRPAMHLAKSTMRSMRLTSSRCPSAAAAARAAARAASAARSRSISLGGASRRASSSSSCGRGRWGVGGVGETGEAVAVFDTRQSRLHGATEAGQPAGRLGGGPWGCARLLELQPTNARPPKGLVLARYGRAPLLRQLLGSWDGRRLHHDVRGRRVGRRGPCCQPPRSAP